MAIVGEQSGVFDSLREWVSSGKPVWGTCAGMILLSNTAIKSKDGGQSLVGGLDVQVCRNYFGSQIASCQIPLPWPEEMAISSPAGGDDEKQEEADRATRAPFPAVFIRAPAVLTVGDSVKVLCKLRARPQRAALEEVRGALGASEGSDDFCPEVIVAVRSGNILATAFHPELTDDDRWHRYFLKMVSES
jgi:5'-phosphate synthase pdxT subunit